MTNSTSNDSASQSSLDLPFQALDLKTTKSLLQDINVIAGSATKTLSSGLAGAAVSGKSFELDARLDRALDRQARRQRGRAGVDTEASRAD